MTLSHDCSFDALTYLRPNMTKKDSAGRVSRFGPVAQLVEHATENRGVDSSILSWATTTGAASFTNRGRM